MFIIKYILCKNLYIISIIDFNKYVKKNCEVIEMIIIIICIISMLKYILLNCIVFKRYK